MPEMQQKHCRFKHIAPDLCEKPATCVIGGGQGKEETTTICYQPLQIQTSGRNSVEEYLPSKQNVVGSNPIARSITLVVTLKAFCSALVLKKVAFTAIDG